MKVLHLLPTNRFSGAENVACQIIGLFSGNPDYEMAYCSPKGPIREEVEGRDIRFIGLESFSRKQIKKAIVDKEGAEPKEDICVEISDEDGSGRQEMILEAE